MALTTSADARAFIDWREMADLANRSDTAPRLTLAELDADANWLAALADANGELLAAVTMGDRYTATEVAALTDPAKSLRDKIVAYLAAKTMIFGRPDKNLPVPAQHNWAEQQLFWLRNGEEIFGEPA